MSTEFTLYLDDGIAPSKVSAFAERAAKDISVSAAEVKDPMRTFLREDHRISPRVRLTFRIASSSLPDAYTSLVRAVLAVLKATSGDALLLYANERTVSRRTAGSLILNRSSGWWTKPLLALVDVPYELGELD